MAIRISWVIEGRVLRASVHGDTTLEDIIQSNETFLEALDRTPNTVHLMVDIQEIGKFPLETMKLMQSQTYLKHPNMGWVALIGTNTVIKFITSVMVQMGLLRMKVVQDFEEAMAVFYKNSPELTGQPIQEIPIITIPADGSR